MAKQRSSRLKTEPKAAKLVASSRKTKPGAVDKKREACARLAEACAIIEEYSDFLPQDARESFTEAMDNLLSAGTVWYSKPALIRECLPAIMYARLTAD